jgi:EAL domain-containing protein (putative c-di-GMP-specific phosphodiesterase class I)
MKKWALNHDIYISLNISAREFEDRQLINVVEGGLKSVGGLDPRHIKLEVTESASMSNPEFTIEQMNSLFARGIELQIDDFGTGFSSLSYLKGFPAKTIKIDKAFVDDIVTNAQEREYLASIIRMVRSREKQVLIEGVTSRGQVELLRKMNCDRMQGFLFSRPVPAEQFEKLLDRGVLAPVEESG